jgi:hypothetical protein
MGRPLSPVSLISGGLTFGVAIAQAAVAMAVLPYLADLLDESPRLAMLGFTGIVAFPAVVATIGHHVGHRFLQSAERVSVKERTGIFPNVQSWWAGALTWLVLYGTTIAMRMIALIINPPERGEGMATITSVMETVTKVAPSNAATLYGAGWVLIAAVFFELERQTRKS